jgi:BirA family biotin operon repressor/biotin-[acetyl-CoA-carboxylase] ligase
LDETESTNDDALAAARHGAAHGALFGAESQRRGRGRRGSAWVSAPGEGLWFSVLLRPELSPELVSGLSLCAGLAVRAALAQRVAASVSVKWPNDVLAGNGKLAGILVESQLMGPRLNSVIVGIGINVGQTAFPDALSSIATSLALLGSEPQSREPLLADVLQQLELELRRLAAGGLVAMAEALRPHDALQGRRLRVDALEGTGAGIDASGRLLVLGSGGELTPVLSGHVELL